MSCIANVGTGGEVQPLNGAPEFLGFGRPARKSAELLSVSMQPLLRRRTAVVLPGAAVGPAPSKQSAFEPYPTKSMIDELAGQPPERGTPLETSATFPAPAAIEIDPTTSGARLTVPPLPLASWTSKYRPGGIVPVKSVFCHEVPAAD